MAPLFFSAAQTFLSAGAVDLDDVFRDVYELVDESLAVDFGQDAALVVVPIF